MPLPHKRALLVFNPVAGHYRVRRLRVFVGCLQNYGWDVVVTSTAYRGHGGQIVQKALAENAADLIIAGGGDGTISEIACEMLGSPVPLAIFPVGSANVLAQELAIPFNDRQNALLIERVFSRSGARMIWPGHIDTPDGQAIFIQMMGIGPDGWIVRHVSTRLKKYIGRTAYLISALKCAFYYKFTPFTLSLDGQSENVTAALITKGRYYGGKFQIIPSSPQEQPLFKVILFRSKNIVTFLQGVLSLILFHKGNKLTEIRTIQSAHIPPCQTINIQIDGDEYKAPEATISIAQKPLRVIAP